MTARVIEAWNLLGGMDWHGIPTAARIMGFDDEEELVRGLVTIRDYKRGIHA